MVTESGAEVSGHFGTGAEVSSDTSAPVPKCLGAEVSWGRSVSSPLDTVLQLVEYGTVRRQQLIEVYDNVCLYLFLNLSVLLSTPLHSKIIFVT